ncbi:DUF2400 family protein [Candidatus Methanodesulfokora washburnensis]|jgi:uncharacterized protein (TIGR02757 family)|uniref:DUF2400 family protein n=1 Tax=Candidatus Methanodesulfokora washburnensis TaxID=2478471 RepID=A0A3R9PU76_9CREN|nr:DUF2400 family protein [Candidatus Methanodesulfokores washburnensis]RSN73174.1 DUF2400 family protein [Candidatus Methanodesulfokores washburnensis]
MDTTLSYASYVLDEAYDRLRDVYLNTSVLGPVRLYSARDTADREFWALFSALIDFQMSVIDILNPMLTGLAKHIEKDNIKFLDLIYNVNLADRVLREFEWLSPKGPRRGFTHRFVKVHDVINLLTIFRRICDTHGSLGNLVKESYAQHKHDPEPMEGVLRDFLKVLLEYGGGPPIIPKNMSSCLKRFNLFFRWLVRPYPDMGLWNFIDKKYLFVSLDQSMQRVISRAFQLDVNLNWHGVLKTTRFLRKLNPEDPTKYDYVLSRISIMGYCTKDPARSLCCFCPIANLCKSSKLPKTVKAKPLTKREMEILEEYIKIHGEELDKIITEYPLEKYSADAVIHMRKCDEYVVEVEEELNYNAIGQVITYRYLYHRIHGKVAKPMIICKRAPPALKEAAQLEQGIEVVEIPNIL